ncbi:hypothetical protein Cfla_0156 [Cellulomonas flavigena DSM 20109]|uniref:DUF4352 domain-containing protein n=1 Tax=Cellulomonas flavigena (strain ATCC 482 / DSM 20109 / BCRC 11376 / JCM 18109 / NBRC 3775 / NCIMB 8073 / NRS 134) TaxID=446466 RepID=D5UG92_CELFN|nr:hypothetical protein [Cellulomonas flavigena]ADG73075.1 hypothetical protein Cfla_0156 [Cellulomonas flavigena DSM 20109]
MTRSTSVRRTRRTAVVAAAAAAVLLAAGCASTASAGGSDEPAQAATYAGTTTTFGESYTYANGLVVEVKAPAAFVPSEGADVAGAEGEAVRVRVNLINGTSNEFVPDKLGVTVVSGGVEATQILDPGSRIELTGPSRPLGRADVVAFDLAFVVEDPEDVTLTLTPALGGYDPVVYTIG